MVQDFFSLTHHLTQCKWRRCQNAKAKNQWTWGRGVGEQYGQSSRPRSRGQLEWYKYTALALGPRGSATVVVLREESLAF